MENTQYKYPIYSLVKHVKTGNNYLIDMHCVIEKGVVPAYAYSSILNPSVKWVRPMLEMQDGRFELII